MKHSLTPFTSIASYTAFKLSLNLLSLVTSRLIKVWRSPLLQRSLFKKLPYGELGQIKKAELDWLSVSLLMSMVPVQVRMFSFNNRQ